MYYKQDTTNCFADKIGKMGIANQVFDGAMNRLSTAQQLLKSDIEQGVPYLTLPSRRDDIDELQSVVEQYRQFDDVVIFGTGGSSLGAEALQQISTITNSGTKFPKLHIITNIDPYTYKHRFRKMDFEKTGFIVISKSGGTLETIMQFLTIVPEIRKVIGEDRLKDVITIITQDGDNPLRKLAQQHNLPVLEHDKDLGGRYSVFSLVGILPALLVGLSAVEFRQGAEFVLQQAIDKPIADSLPAIGASIQVGLMEQDNISASVLLAYSDRLGSLARWYRQLWAESLGKDGYGTSPIYGMGPVDQHSQLQLWLDGPKDKFFTLIHTEKDVKTDPIEDTYLDAMDMEYIRGRSLADLMESSCFATYQTLADNGRPTRMLSLDGVSVSSMGAVMMHYILETVFSAHLLGVNPFDQPAVEQGKVLIRQRLKDMNNS